MKKSHLLIAALLLALSALSARPASALPAWCTRYTAQDSFETPAQWGEWWNSLSGGYSFVGYTGASRSGSDSAYFQFGSTENTSSFLIVERVLSVYSDTNTALNYRYPSRGCVNPSPTYPSTSKKPLFCSVDVWVQAPTGAAGAIQIIDPNSWTYLGQQGFNLLPNSAWQDIQIVNDLTCESSMDVRIVMNWSASRGVYMFADDVTVEWYY